MLMVCTLLEKAPLERAARDGQLMTYKHEGFWQYMNTVREKDRVYGDEIRTHPSLDGFLFLQVRIRKTFAVVIISGKCQSEGRLRSFMSTKNENRKCEN